MQTSVTKDAPSKPRIIDLGLGKSEGSCVMFAGISNGSIVVILFFFWIMLF